MQRQIEPKELFLSLLAFVFQDYNASNHWFSQTWRFEQSWLFPQCMLFHSWSFPSMLSVKYCSVPCCAWPSDFRPITGNQVVQDHPVKIPRSYCFGWRFSPGICVKLLLPRKYCWTFPMPVSPSCVSGISASLFLPSANTYWSLDMKGTGGQDLK